LITGGAEPKHEESKDLDQESDIMLFDEPESVNLNKSLIKPSIEKKINSKGLEKYINAIPTISIIN
jgi:hypothetical protein